MIEFGRVPGKGSIRASTEKLSERVLERGGLSVSTGKGRIRVSTEKLSRRVPKNGIISVSTEKWSNPGQYRERV